MKELAMVCGFLGSSFIKSYFCRNGGYVLEGGLGKPMDTLGAGIGPIQLAIWHWRQGGDPK